MDYARTILSLSPGDSLVGRYKLVARLGRGAMGEVWKATDLELCTTVAVKLLPPEFVGLEAADKRMKDEATIGRTLAHESIVRLHDYQRDPARQKLSFLVMEFVEGRTLADILDAEGPQPLSRVIGWAKSLAAGIDYANAKKVLHRDIKPGNVMIETATGRARLLDFGIGREIRNTMSEVSQKADSSGTPAYMSPQQLMGENHPSNDIYSLAATLYHALSGKPPFTDGHIQTQILHKPAAPIHGQPRHVNSALLAGLAKKAEARPASARALVESMARPPKPPPPPTSPPAGAVRDTSSAAKAADDPLLHADLASPLMRGWPADTIETITTEVKRNGIAMSRDGFITRGKTIRFSQCKARIGSDVTLPVMIAVASITLPFFLPVMLVFVFDSLTSPRPPSEFIGVLMFFATANAMGVGAIWLARRYVRRWGWRVIGRAVIIEGSGFHFGARYVIRASSHDAFDVVSRFMLSVCRRE